MKKALVVALLLLSQGCAVLGNRHVAAGCQVADGVSTYVALKSGAVELNPVLSGASPAAILVLKLAIAYWVWRAFDGIEEQNRGVLTAIAAVGCVPAVNNFQVIKTLR